MMSGNRLTKQDIMASSDPYGLTSDYALEFRYNHDFDNAAVATLPKGLQDVLIIVALDSECNNGGLMQYLGNRQEDGWWNLSDEVFRVPDALRSMGAVKMADLVTAATKCWLSLEAKYSPIDEYLDSLEPQILRFAEIIPFDEQFFDIYDETAVQISEHIRRNADEFCHTE